jgi:uncharacterized protein YybS (DUF2232 family)
MNDNVHASPFEVRHSSLSHIIKVRVDFGNDVDDARYGARSSVLRASVMIVVVMFPAMSMVVVFVAVVV